MDEGLKTMSEEEDYENPDNYEDVKEEE